MDCLRADFSSHMISGTALLWFGVSWLLSTVSASAWMEHTGSCYMVHETNTQKQTAEVMCAAVGGAVTEMETPGEYIVVNEVLQGFSDEAWVGLQKIKLSDNFTWTNAGTKPDADMWKTGEPNFTGTCARLVRFFNTSSSATGVIDLGLLQLADHPCASLYRPFCEKPASPAVSHSKKLSTLSEKLCPVSSQVTSGVLECAQLCARQTSSCYVYSYRKASRACTFHRLSSNCVKNSSEQPGVVHYRITRDCT